MKFIASSSSLLKHLQQISGVISSTSVLPILDNFLFDIEDRRLNIIATDLETVMRVQMEVESNDNGKVCIPAKILIDTLKNLPDQPLTFDIDEQYAIEITSDTGKYKVLGENPDNFPKEPEAEATNTFTMNSTSLVTAINNTLFAASNDDLRPAMTGVLFDMTTDALQFVATDAHRLVKYVRSDVKCPDDTSIIVPKKPLHLVRNIFPNDDSTLELSYNDKHLFVSKDATRLVCRLIDARFPDYRVVIPADNPFTLVVNRSDFQNALRRLMVFSNKSTNQVVLTITGNELALASQDIDLSFEGNERMSCQFDGEDMQIAFNAKFLVEMLNVTDTDEVKISLSTPTRPGILKPSEIGEDEDILMLVMPLMINA